MRQSQALDIMKSGVNVFLTGEPGSGKTYVVNQYVAYLRSHGIDPAITASTGIAATHIGGLTIHAWAGLGIKKELSRSDLAAIAANRRVAKRISAAKILIIDEVSMLPPEVLALVDAVCQKIKKNSAPFGGLQIILVGDFFQLPPVVKTETPKPAALLDLPAWRFAFQTPVWQKAGLTVCYLTEQYRQLDSDFTDLLSAIRKNDFAEIHLALIKSRLIDFSQSPDNAPKLFSHNADVDRINNDKLVQLPGRLKNFMMSGYGPGPLVAVLQKGCLSPRTLGLKIKAAVMFTKNDHQGRFVNGTLGTVLDFDELSGYPVVATKAGKEILVEPSDWTLEENGSVRAKINQLPLRLAWAITIHKSQGMSLDEAVMDLSEVFEFGQGYVALSRVRRLLGLHLLGYNKRAFEVDRQVLTKDQEFRAGSSAVETDLAKASAGEAKNRQRDFILACGGKLEKSGFTAKNKIKIDTYLQTLALWQQDKSLAVIAKKRGLTEGTIIGHLEKLAAKNKISQSDLAGLLSPSLVKALPEIAEAFTKLGFERLSPVFEKLGSRYSYDQLRLCRLALKSFSTIRPE
ncbi:MAG: helix-turn-helix domain-containing protein [Candidatus Buchananbacteria bacterium]